MKKIVRYSSFIVLTIFLAACNEQTLPDDITEIEECGLQAGIESLEEPEVEEEIVYHADGIGFEHNLNDLFAKNPNDFSENELQQLSEIRYLNFDVKENFDFTMLSQVCPNVQFLSFSYYFEPIPETVWDAIAQMEGLRGICVEGQSFHSLKKLKEMDLLYVELLAVPEYNAESGTFFDFDFPLEEVMAADYAEAAAKFEGDITYYCMLYNEGRKFELACSETINELAEDYSLEAYVFVTSQDPPGGENLQILQIDGRVINGTGGFLLQDVNFDGKADILVKRGVFGTQAATMYACYLDSESGFIPAPGFREIINPSLDFEQKKVLSTWRNWAASHSWAMYEFLDGDFIMTDCLTEEAVRGEDDREYWDYTVEKLVDGQWQVTEYYNSKEIPNEEIWPMFYEADTYWGLYSSKWHTLNNLGSYIGYAIYSSHMPNQAVMDVME